MLLARRRRTEDSDAELVEQVRAGHDEAFAELYRRHRRVAASTAAWLLRSSGDVDDVVADAFASLLQALRNGHGPRDDFRAYLLACVRNASIRRRQTAPAVVGLDPEAAGVAYEDPERYVEADTVARAFAALSPRWQRALWLAEVEDRTPAEIAGELGLAPNAVAALTYRAREGFATAYLAEHVARASTTTCAAVGPRLGAYVRDGASATERAAIDAHLAECADCRRAVEELDDLNASLRSLQGPAAGAAAAVAVATTLPVTGGVAMLAGSGAAVKVVAAVMALVPTVAFGVHQLGTGGSVDMRPPVIDAAVVRPADDATATGNGSAVTSDAATTTSAVRAAAATTAAGGVQGTAPATTAAAATPPPVTAPTVPPLPPVTTPAVSLPPITTPALTTPPVGLPPITTPAVTTPPITVTVPVPPVSLPVVPTVTVPTVTIPGVTVPSVTVPAVTVPSVTVPAVTVPSVTVPAVTVPSVTVPAVTVPSVTAPTTLPPITVPGLG